MSSSIQPSWRTKTMEHLHMNRLRDLIYRLRAGESERRVARDMSLSRTTVRKYRELAEPLGYLRPEQALPDDATLFAMLGSGPRPPQVPSMVEPYQEAVQRLVDQGVEMTAIFQRLRDDHGYAGSYSAVRRYVHRLCPATPEAVVRVHTAPGEELQVDFGSVGQLYDPDRGQPRPAWGFVATLGFSRHQYAEFVFDQKTPTWIGLHRRAFESFGGVPQRVVPDNLKPAVLQALVYDPVLGEAYRRLGLHYGFLISPTAPRQPQHKGKVENGVHYVQRNFLAGQEFVDIRVANERLQVWVREVAGTRQHGTTHQAPLQLFYDYEQAALRPLPAEPFSLCAVKPVKVHPDCHITIAGSYYSVPYRYIGQTLDAYIGERVVEIFQGIHLVATHLRCAAPGQWQTRLEDYPPDKADYLKRTPVHCRETAARVGPATQHVIETLLGDRPLDRLRSAQAILRLAESVGRGRLEAACARAAYFGDIRYRRIKDILNAALDREPLPSVLPAAPRPAFAFARPAAEFFARAQEARP
jgi:transposase